MAWILLNVSIAIKETTIACQDGTTLAIIKVNGKTNDDKVSNPFTVSLRDDYVIPDILWDSGPLFADPGETVRQQFEVKLWCNKRCKVVGPAGSSHEKTAEVYALAAGEEMEGQSDEISVSCVK